MTTAGRSGGRTTSLATTRVMPLDGILPTTGSPLHAGCGDQWRDMLLETVSARIDIAARSGVETGERLLSLYWHIGRDILSAQEQQPWGSRIVAQLAIDLSERFRDDPRYSRRNVTYMRAFAAAWPDWQPFEDADTSCPATSTGIGALSWYHHPALLEKLDSRQLREWYADRAVRHAWSRRDLVRHIAAGEHRTSRVA